MPTASKSPRFVGHGLVLIVFFVCVVTVWGQGPANPVPYVSQPMVPTSVVPGRLGFSLTVEGTGFVNGATVKWNGNARTTAFVGSSKVTAMISASDVATAGTAAITVTNPGPGGGTSNVQFFSVTNPVATVSLARLDHQPTDAVNVEGDFNGDGKLDLANVAQGPGENLILPNACVELGNGDGTFRSAQCFAGPQGGATTLVAADFNGDGNLDLAAADSTSGAVSMLLGNGDGTFRSSKVVTQPLPNLVGLVTADFNGDGKLDVVAAWDSGQPLITVSVYLGNGDGSFSTHVDTTFAGTTEYMTFGDFNLDGKLDLAFVDASGSILVLFGNGDGNFQSPRSVAPGGASALSITAADINSDGKLDLIVLKSFGDVSVFLGNGDGTFQPSIDSPSGNRPLSLQIGDINADGKLDIAILAMTSDNGDGTTSDSTLSILFGNGDGTFRSPAPYSGVFVPLSFSLGDFNSDGTQDLAVSTKAGLSVFLQGALPVLGAFPNNLQFQPQGQGTTSPPQQVVFTNTGTSTVTIFSVALTGVDAGNFAESDTCGSLLSVGATCEVNLTFTPTGNTHPDASGYIHAALTINNNGVEDPQTVPLSAVAKDFSLSPTVGPSTIATVTAGQTATYNILVAPVGGFSQVVALTCIGAPDQSTCSVSPASVTLSNGQGTGSVVTVRTSTSSKLLSLFGVTGILVLAGFVGLVRPLRVPQAWVVVLLLGCGGGMMSACSNSKGAGNPGTPSGTYQLTVTGTSSSGSITIAHAIQLTLVVQ